MTLRDGPPQPSSSVGTDHSGAAAASLTDRRQLKGAARRVRILDAATRVFARHGYEGTRLAVVAQESGMTDAGLLHHFGSKRELFMAVVERREDLYSGIRLDDDTTARQLFDMFVAAVEHAAGHPDLVRFRAMLTGAAFVEGNPIQGRSARALEQALTHLAPVLARAVERGELRPSTDPTQVVLEILALNEGIRDQWVTRPDLVDYVGVFRTALDDRYEAIATTLTQGMS